MTQQKVRPLAICTFRNNDRILVHQGYDAVKDQHFYRPLGGGIEFGEPGAETVCRELMEELNVEVDRDSLQYLGALENIFTFNGAPGHEIVLVYEGKLKEATLYDHDAIVGKDVNGEQIRAIWKKLDEFGEGKSILYPNGLLDMLPATAP